MQPVGWVMDSGASGHMAANDGILLSHLPSSHSFITVVNGHTLPVSCRGNSLLPAENSNFQLNGVLSVTSLIPNLISVKDIETTRVILHCNSSGDLYTIPPAASSTRAVPLII